MEYPLCFRQETNSCGDRRLYGEDGIYLAFGTFTCETQSRSSRSVRFKTPSPFTDTGVPLIPLHPPHVGGEGRQEFNIVNNHPVGSSVDKELAAVAVNDKAMGILGDIFWSRW